MTTSLNSSAATIRHATRDDLPAIDRLLRQADLPTDGVAEIIQERPADFFVAESHGDLIAVAGLEVCCDDALLRSVAVSPEWRSHGLGRDLVQRIVSYAEERGIRTLFLLT